MNSPFDDPQPTFRRRDEANKPTLIVPIIGLIVIALLVWWNFSSEGPSAPEPPASLERLQELRVDARELRRALDNSDYGQASEKALSLERGLEILIDKAAE